MTTQSESIGKLSEALSKVQGQLSGAKLDSTNPFFNNKYADLTSVWEACRALLASNGLCVVQTMGIDTEAVIVDTTLAHSSGEWIRGSLRLMPAQKTPQGIGSCITYARRYSLAAIVGIAPEDDDGNAASAQPATPKRQTAKPATTAQAPAPTPTAPTESEDLQKAALIPTIQDLLTDLYGANASEYQEKIHAQNKVTSLGNMTVEQLKKTVGLLESRKAKGATNAKS